MTDLVHLDVPLALLLEALEVFGEVDLLLRAHRLQHVLVCVWGSGLRIQALHVRIGVYLRVSGFRGIIQGLGSARGNTWQPLLTLL